jgi:hypothetical protein
MADQVTYPGRLIAIDGSRGKDVNASADAVAAGLRQAGIECVVSRWDASGLFGDLAVAAKSNRNISTRTLSLVYAADLAFRLRWEIRPVLEAGGVVVASQYVETAIAFGAACGLREEWLRELLRFAPAADLRGRAEERKIDRPWKRRTDRGYPEYGAVMLDASAPRKASKRAREKMMQMLDLVRGRKIYQLKGKGLAALVATATGSPKGAPSRASSRPRSGRT